MMKHFTLWGRFCSGILFLFLIANSADARLAVNPLFTSKMVLQQKMPVPIWGTATPGKEVTVRFGKQSQQTVTNAQGKWILKLDSMPSRAVGQSLLIEGDQGKIVLEDVLVGEVWIGSGQSNMAYTMSQTEDGKKALPDATHSNIRVFKRPSSRRGRETWTACTPEAVKDFSAVAYFFAKEMHHRQKVPVGIIVRAVGGTTIQRWVPENTALENEFINHRVQEANSPEAENDFSRYETEKNKYDKRNKPSLETAKWLSKMSNLVHYRGSHFGGLYSRMIKPLQPMAIRGVIWYQGEFNNRPGQAYDYRYWQETLVNSWRKEWGQGEFPFLFVQMQVLGNGTTCLLRESQATTLDRCPQTAMAVICDQSVGLHPPYKEIAGKRLVIASENLLQKDSSKRCGPKLKKMTVQGNQILLEFDDVGEGLVLNETKLSGFFLCGNDKQFQPAQAKLVGKSQVVVWSEKIKSPEAVRYAWLNDPRKVMLLFDQQGLPATPFRTDQFANTASLDKLLPREVVRKKKKKK